MVFNFKNRIELKLFFFKTLYIHFITTNIHINENINSSIEKLIGLMGFIPQKCLLEYDLMLMS